MEVVAFIEPPQEDVIERILRGHQSTAMVDGLWRSSAARATPVELRGLHNQPWPAHPGPSCVNTRKAC